MNHAETLADVTLQLQKASHDRHAPPPALLFGVQGPMRGMHFALTQPRVQLGRSSDNDLPIEAPDVSSFHCIIEQDGRVFRIIDEDSRNGTFVNSRELAPHSPLQLTHGDKIVLGSAVFLFLHPDSSANVDQPTEITIDLAAAEKEANAMLEECREMIALRKARRD
jgi:predicted component of type VI protein secretion system